MLGRLVPERLKEHLKAQFQWLVRSSLPDVMPCREGFFPHQPRSRHYLVPKDPPPPERHEGTPLPVPPKEFWERYGPKVEWYLHSGEKDVQVMRGILAQSGWPVESATRILELGCSSARMIRWLHDLAGTREVWGIDVSASRILWCQQYLSPPFHFATTTIFPHLPFEDRYFDFLYAGSVFTHIDDLADAWFLELRRVVRPGGRLYITIHDRKTVADLEGEYREHPVSRGLRSVPEYGQYSRTDFGMFTIERSTDSQVFYDVDFLRRKLGPFFRVLSANESAYSYQTAVLLERV